jgi:hypothetical protein
MTDQSSSEHEDKEAEVSEAAGADPVEEALEEVDRGVDEAFIPPPSTAPATMQATAQFSRAGHKRAPTMRPLEAEQVPKWVSGQWRARGCGRGSRRGRDPSY